MFNVKARQQLGQNPLSADKLYLTMTIFMYTGERRGGSCSPSLNGNDGGRG